MHQALLALGQSVTADISGDLWGPWDAAGVLLVLSAGGVAQRFAFNNKGGLDPRDPLNSFEYQLLVMAADQPTLNKLIEDLEISI